MPRPFETGRTSVAAWRHRVPGAAEAGVLIGLFAMYLASFVPSSAVHGPLEIFAQDSVYLLESLAQGGRYPWNPQNHLLHHFLVELGYEPWRRLFGSSFISAYHYLKLFTALTGLAFLLVLRALLRELGLGPARRSVLLALAGISVSVWFHGSAFETHCLALPAVALYLLCLVRLRDRTSRSMGDRLMLVGSLVAAGLVRVDLFRFAVVSVLLPWLPGARRWWRSLAVDLALVGVLAVAGYALIARIYFDVPLREVTSVVLDRFDRPDLEGRLQRLDNLAPRNLVTIGRAVTLYSMVMPVDPRPAGRSFFAPPDYDLKLTWREDEVRPSTGLFLQPARNLLGYALSLLALVAVAALLGCAVAASVRRVVAGDPVHAMLVAQAAAAWLLYTWFNPLEPFLWVVEFVPLWIVMIAELLRPRGGSFWVALGLVAVILGLHNLFAFYLPFR